MKTTALLTLLCLTGSTLAAKGRVHRRNPATSCTTTKPVSTTTKPCASTTTAPAPSTCTKSIPGPKEHCGDGSTCQTIETCLVGLTEDQCSQKVTSGQYAALTYNYGECHLYSDCCGAIVTTPKSSTPAPTCSTDDNCAKSVLNCKCGSQVPTGLGSRCAILTTNGKQCFKASDCASNEACIYTSDTVGSTAGTCQDTCPNAFTIGPPTTTTTAVGVPVPTCTANSQCAVGIQYCGCNTRFPETNGGTCTFHYPDDLSNPKQRCSADSDCGSEEQFCIRHPNEQGTSYGVCEKKCNVNNGLPQ